MFYFKEYSLLNCELTAKKREGIESLVIVEFMETELMISVKCIIYSTAMLNM